MFQNLLLFFLILFSIPTILNAEIITIEKKVSMVNDDAEESLNGVVNTISSDLELTEDDTLQTIGIRFSNIDIPKDASIKKAYIQFRSKEASKEITHLKIQIEDSSKAKLFLNIPYNISSRKKRDTFVTWQPLNWFEHGEKEEQQTPDIKKLIEEIIALDDWDRDNNAIAFIITGIGDRVATSFRDLELSNLKYAPSLHIEYSMEKEQKEVTKKSEELNISSPLKINEILASNSSSSIDLDEKEFSDWIELYNDSNTSLDIGGFSLSTNINLKNKWKIPKNTKIVAHGYLLIWADETNQKALELHANFKLSSKGGAVILLNAQSKIIDKVLYPKQKSDISYGREKDKIGYMTPSPHKKNGKIFKSNKRYKAPIFSKISAFYEGNQTLEITTKKDKKDRLIYYTLDGSIPTKKSNKYIAPIHFSKTTVVRARVFGEHKFPSKVLSHTYFIDENITLPVVALAIDPKYLYDKQIGIAEHYNERWIRAASFSFLEKGELKVSENIGMRISGNHTRWYPQKSFAIYAKKRYGKKSIKYPLFRDKPQIKKVKSFILRNSGTHWGHSMMHEGVSHQIVKDKMDIDYQSFQPVVVFLNAKYWGIYNIREKMNIDYLKSNHHIGKKEVDLIENDDTPKEGNLESYQSLIKYIKTHDMSNDAYFKVASSQIDMPEFINHIIVESFFGNSSIHHNIKRWRLKSENGKWRTLLFDLDRGFQNPRDNILGYVLDDDESSLIFTYFMQNENFVKLFTDRYLFHLDNTFNTKRVNSFIAKAKAEIEPEMERHFKKWSEDKDKQSVSVKTWEKDIEKMFLFAKERPSLVREKLKESFNN